MLQESCGHLESLKGQGLRLGAIQVLLVIVGLLLLVGVLVKVGILVGVGVLVILGVLRALGVLKCLNDLIGVKLSLCNFSHPRDIDQVYGCL